MDVCTLEVCRLGMDKGNDCFVRKWLQKGTSAPKQYDFGSEYMSVVNVVTLCHWMGTIHELVTKYREPWMRRPRSKTLDAHNSMQRLMISAMSLWWEGIDIWLCIVYKIGARDFNLTAADLRKCLKLPRNVVPPEGHKEDVMRFQAACKSFFQTCLKITDEKTDATVLQTVRTRLSQLEKAF